MEVDVDAYLRPAAGLSRSEWSEFDQVFVDLNDVRCASIPSSWCPSSPTTTQDQAKLEDVRPDRESVSSLSDWVQEEILGRLVLPLVCASVFAIPADLCDDDKPDGPEKTNAIDDEEPDSKRAKVSVETGQGLEASSSDGRVPSFDEESAQDGDEEASLQEVVEIADMDTMARLKVSDNCLTMDFRNYSDLKSKLRSKNLLPLSQFPLTQQGHHLGENQNAAHRHDTFADWSCKQAVDEESTRFKVEVDEALNQVDFEDNFYEDQDDSMCDTYLDDDEDDDEFLFEVPSVSESDDGSTERPRRTSRFVQAGDDRNSGTFSTIVGDDKDFRDVVCAVDEESFYANDPGQMASKRVQRRQHLQVSPSREMGPDPEENLLDQMNRFLDQDQQKLSIEEPQVQTFQGEGRLLDAEDSLRGQEMPQSVPMKDLYGPPETGLQMDCSDHAEPVVSFDGRQSRPQQKRSADLSDRVESPLSSSDTLLPSQSQRHLHNFLGIVMPSFSNRAPRLGLSKFDKVKPLHRHFEANF